MFEVIALVQQCAPAIDTNVALSIIKKESSFNPFAIGVNKGGRLERQPKDYTTAVLTAKKLINDGYNIDIGYAQINSSNLKKLGMNVRQALEPCNNLKAMQYILSDCFSRAGNYETNTKLSRAFSCYNSGNYSGGFSNGYVNSVNKNLINFISNNYGKQKQLGVKSISSMNGNELANFANSLPTSLPNEASGVVYNSLNSGDHQPSLISAKNTSNTDKVFHDVFSSSKNDIFN